MHLFWGLNPSPLNTPMIFNLGVQLNLIAASSLVLLVEAISKCNSRF